MSIGSSSCACMCLSSSLFVLGFRLGLAAETPTLAEDTSTSGYGESICTSESMFLQKTIHSKKQTQISALQSILHVWCLNTNYCVCVTPNVKLPYMKQELCVSCGSAQD